MAQSFSESLAEETLNNGESVSQFFRAINDHDLRTVDRFMRLGMTHRIWSRYGDPLGMLAFDCNGNKDGKAEKISQVILEEGSYLNNRHDYPVGVDAIAYAIRRCKVRIHEVPPDVMAVVKEQAVPAGEWKTDAASVPPRQSTTCGCGGWKCRSSSTNSEVTKAS